MAAYRKCIIRTGHICWIITITLHTLFEELDEDTDFTEVTAKRIDITAKYRGTSVKFKELLGKMDADAEMLSQTFKRERSGVI